MAKITLNDIINTYNLTLINSNFTKIENEFQNKALYRNNPNGEPNEMQTNLDMNNRHILNLPAPAGMNEPIRLLDFLNGQSGYGQTISSLDEGTLLTTKTTSVNYTGGGVTATILGNNVTVDIPSVLPDLASPAGASMIGSTPSGGISSGNVQAALNELDSEKVAITELSDTSDTLKGDSLVGVKQPLAGAQGRTQHEKNFDIKSFSDFCPSGKTFATMTTAETLTAVQAAWASALATPHDLMNWGETIDIGDANFPWQQPGINPATLLDCKNVTIHGVGPSSVFKTTSPDGADVFQLNGLKNFHARNLKITATLTGFAGSGSNGISVTGGFDNITLLDIYCENLPGLDKGTSTDGGDALSIQSSTAVAECGTLVARIYAKGCMRGFNILPGLSQWLVKKPSVTVDVVAEDCYQAVTVSAAGAAAAVPAGMQYGIKVNAMAINCQHDLVLARAHGGEFNVEVITNKTAAARRINPNTAAAWFASDTIVDSLLCTYAKNAGIVVYGNKGECDYKARIGGTTAGSSGLNGATEYCDITFDVGGTASISDLLSVNSGGNTLRSNRLDFSTVTISALPSDFTTIGNANRILWGANYNGTATLTLTGCTTSPTGVVNYSLNGDVVTINIPDITGTSNTTAATLTGLPAEIYPSATRSCINRVVDNGTEKIALTDISSVGVLTLYNGPGSVTFTNTGTKGVKACSITYKR